MEIIPILFYPMLATIIASVVVTAASITAVRLADKKIAHIVKIISGVIVLCGIIACIVCMSLYYANEIEPSGLKAAVPFACSSCGICSALLT